MKVSAPRKRPYNGGSGRFSGSKAAKRKSVAGLPGRAVRGRSKATKGNPMAHGGNC